jgi:predicted dehydrogenase
MNSLIKIGVLGTANIALKSVIPNIKVMSDYFQLAGVASRSSDKLLAISKLITCNLYLGYDSLLNDESIDAIYIPLPNALHFEWIKKSLNKGKHVLVEKSLGCSLAEVDYLTNLAKKYNLVILENFQFRFHPQLDLIKEIINNGIIGEFRSLRASFGFPPFLDQENIRYKKELGGGALLDAGAYTTKISQILLGNNLKVNASNLNFNLKYDVDIWGGAYLSNQNSGMFSQLSFGFDNHYQCGIEIWGSKGKLTTNRLFTAPSDYKPEIIIENSSSLKEIVIAPNANQFEKMLLHFYKLINSKVGIDLEHEQNLDQARLLNDIKAIAYEK